MFDLRDLSTIAYSLATISLHKPVVLNFDALLTELELPIVLKLDLAPAKADPQSLANIAYAYAKSQNGSQQFFRALEPHIIAKKEALNTQELANIIVSYQKADTADNDLVYELVPTVVQQMDAMKPKELAALLLALTDMGFFSEPQPKSPYFDVQQSARQVLAGFERQFNSKHDVMNAEDISKFYFCFTTAFEGFQGKGTFYKYLQKALTKTIKTFESQDLRLMFVRFNAAELRLNTGVQGRLRDRLLELMDKKQMRGFDVNFIYNETKTPAAAAEPNEDEPQKATAVNEHAVASLCAVYLQKLKYFS